MGAAVTDGVTTHLIAIVVCLLADVTVKSVALQDEAAGLRSVGVGLEEFGAA